MKPKLTSLGLHIKVADFDLSRRFYESLGFEPVFGYGDEDFRASLPEGVGSAPERFRGLVFQVGNATLEIANGHVAVVDEVFDEKVGTSKVSATVKVESLVPLLQNPLVKITFPVRHYYWGTIEAAFRDPDGFVLVFIAPFSEAELESVKKLKAVETITPNS